MQLDVPLDYYLFYYVTSYLNLTPNLCYLISIKLGHTVCRSFSISLHLLIQKLG